MNTQMNSRTDQASGSALVASLQAIVQKLNAIPYSVIALIARAATFSVFFRSGTQKLSDWNSTLLLFQNEYHVPVLPPNIAAYMAASLELGASTLVLVGLCTRVSVTALLGMTAVSLTISAVYLAGGLVDRPGQVLGGLVRRIYLDGIRAKGDGTGVRVVAESPAVRLKPRDLRRGVP